MPVGVYALGRLLYVAMLAYMFEYSVFCGRSKLCFWTRVDVGVAFIRVDVGDTDASSVTAQIWTCGKYASA